MFQWDVVAPMQDSVWLTMGNCDLPVEGEEFKLLERLFPRSTPGRSGHQRIKSESQLSDMKGSAEKKGNEWVVLQDEKRIKQVHVAMKSPSAGFRGLSGLDLVVKVLKNEFTAEQLSNV